MPFSLTLVNLLLSGCIPALFFCFGLLIAVSGFWALLKEFAISKHGLVLPGTVIAIDARQARSRRRSRTTTVYNAVVRFQMLENDGPVTFIVSTGSFEVSLHQFERVPKAEIYLIKLEKGTKNGQGSKSLHKRIQRGSGAAGRNELAPV